MFTVVGVFDKSSDALSYTQNNKIDFALLDIEMPNMNGIELAEKLKQRHPNIIIIFVTAYGQYALDAYKIKADFLVLKPYSKEDIEDALARARLLSARQKKRVFIRTFGQFEVYVADQLIHFSSAKAKELLAVLVDRRGVVSSREILMLIWEDKFCDDTSLSLCRRTAFRLRQELKKYDIDDMLIESKQGRSLNKEVFDCDYYQLLQRDANLTDSFTGEYMSQYSWAENTLAGLQNICDNQK